MSDAYEDADFVELHQLPAQSQDGEHEYFWFVFRHKKSGDVFQAIARSRQDLAEKINVGDYKDADHRNTRDEDEDDAEE